MPAANDTREGKLVYLSIVEDSSTTVRNREATERCTLGARYTHTLLRSTLQLMGCKPRTAHQVCFCVFCNEAGQSFN